jgi:cholesterol transport system auxiliary component
VRRRSFLAGSAAGLLGACSLAPKTAQPALYDFGLTAPPASPVRLDARIALAEVSANAWLQTPAIVYRLAYDDAARLRPYALSRWAAPPAELLAQRLRFALAQAARNGFSMPSDGLPVDQALRVHLEAFEQVVDSPQSSRAIVRVLARLASADRRARAQRLFEAEQPCGSVDAPGSVHALIAATDALIAQMLPWVASEARA